MTRGQVLLLMLFVIVLAAVGLIVFWQELPWYFTVLVVVLAALIVLRLFGKASRLYDAECRVRVVR
jgi:hypothetical protein